MNNIIKKVVSVILSAVIAFLMSGAGFAYDFQDMSEYHNFPRFTDYREKNTDNFERTSDTLPNAVSSPVLSNGSYDFYDLTSDWSSSDGSIYWDDSSQTLTLDGAYISSRSTSGDNFGIYVPHNSNIVLKGENTVYSGDAGYGGYDSMGIICNGNLRIKGSGSLVVESGDSTRNSYGILARYDVIIEDCNIKATGGYGTQFSAGFSSEEGDVSVTNATFSCTGGESDTGCSVGVDSVATFNVDNSVVEGYASDSPLNWGLYIGTLVAKDSEISGFGADVPESVGSASIYCSYGIYVNENVDAQITEFTANGGNVAKYGNGSASYGFACKGDMGISVCNIIANGGESVNTSYGIFVGGKCIMDICAVSSVSSACESGIAFSGKDIIINGGIYKISCEDSNKSASGMFSENSININGGEISVDSHCNNNVFAISASEIYINSGKITARASESNGNSCGVYGKISIECGDVISTGEDSAFDGNIAFVSENCKIKASEEFESDNLIEGSLVSGNVKANMSNSIAKTAQIFYDMNGQKIYAYTFSDNLSYRDSTRILAHCESPVVMYKYESSDNSIIKVENSVHGVVKAVNAGTATIKVTATDLFTGEPIKDSYGNIASTTIEIKCTMTFWERIVRFFRVLFGLD